MNRILVSLILFLGSCTQDIAGLSPEQRFKLYELSLAATGHPEAAVLVKGVEHIAVDKTSGK